MFFFNWKCPCWAAELPGGLQKNPLEVYALGQPCLSSWFEFMAAGPKMPGAE